MPLDNADNIINASGALSSLDDASGDTAPPGPPPAEGTPEGFDPERWALLRIRMSAPVPALTSPEATELLWQILRRSPVEHRGVVFDALDAIGHPFEGFYSPTALEAEDAERRICSTRNGGQADDGEPAAPPRLVDATPLPTFPGDDRDDEYGWRFPLDMASEVDWWAA